MLPLILAAAVQASAMAAPTPAQAPSPDLAPSMEAAIRPAIEGGFAGVVLVGDTRGVLYDRTISAPGRAHTPGETWRWASVTKQLTATLALQAVDAGRLSLDDTLADRLPAFRGSTAGAVTIRMLLQHTSGLPNPDATPTPAEGFPAFYTRTGADVGGLADALGYCAGRPRAAPGAGFDYNNCDYIVLGAVLERTAGAPFAAILKTRLTGPLGLNSVAMARAGVPAPPMAAGFLDAAKPEPPFTLATFGPAGAAYGQPMDLLRFDQALLSGKLLSEKARDLAWAGAPKLGYVALGAWGFPARLEGCAGPVKLVERRGEIGGVEVRNLIAPEIGRALVVLSDRSDIEFGEIWQGKGLSWRLASAAFCASAGAPA